MKCPGCFAGFSICWEPPVYKCRACGYELTKREYQIEIESSHDRRLASPPDDDSDRIIALEAEVERLRGLLETTRAWAIRAKAEARSAAAVSTRVLEELNTALEPAP